MVHISDMSWERLSSAELLVKPGDQIQVQILKIDLDQDPPRIGLGMKRATDPFVASVGAAPKEVVEGTVTRLAEFGAFVQLQVASKPDPHLGVGTRASRRGPPDRQEGQVVSVKILQVDAEKKRIALSLKQAQGDESASFDQGEDPMIRKLKAKWGDGPLKGGIG